MQPFKIQIKLGAFEFSAEGEEATVKNQLEQFMAFVNKAPTPPPTPVVPPASQEAPQSPKREAPAGQIAPPNGNGHSVPENVAQLFLKENDELTLRVHPEEKSGDKIEQIREAFIALMYGLKKIGGVEDVISLTAVEGLRNSGIPVDRLNDAIRPLVGKGIITKTGVNRGTRYRLTNKGTAEAERIIGELIQRL